MLYRDYIEARYSCSLLTASKFSMCVNHDFVHNPGGILRESVAQPQAHRGSKELQSKSVKGDYIGLIRGILGVSTVAQVEFLQV